MTLGRIRALAAAVVLVGSCAQPEHPPADLDQKLLKSLPYLNWVEVDREDVQRNGVVTYVPEKAFAGLNLYSSNHSRRAVLMDMQGNETHAWRGDGLAGWHHVELGPDGTLYAIERDIALTKLDAHSNTIWRRELRAHHDLALDDAGRVYVLTREPAMLETTRGARVPIIDDAIEILSPAGERLRKIPISTILGDRVPPERIRALRHVAHTRPDLVAGRDRLVGPDPEGVWPEPIQIFDVFHTNTLELLPGGRALICAFMLHIVAIVDLDEEKVLWSWGPGELEHPHQPTMLPNGNLLIFDNGQYRGYSRVVEVDPKTAEIVWTYTEGPQGSFFSKYQGGNQPLPNGNVLITESNDGRAFEITRDGELVWEFFNPERKADQRAGMYRLVRIEAPPAWIATESLEEARSNRH